MYTPKIVTTPHYHIWTDALHARALAHQARNRWDKGTYVRWCGNTAWTALEIACQDATGDKSISYSFKKNLDKAIESMDLPPLNWGSGIWHRVSDLQKQRKGYVHPYLSDIDLFADATIADDIIVIIRSAINDIYKHLGKSAPTWTADDEDRGWDKKPRLSGNATRIHKGADRDGVDTIKICFIKDGVELTSDILPPQTKWEPYVEELIGNLQVPASEIRVYQGGELINSKELHMRGS